MTADPVNTLILPVALGVIMFGLGLGLRAGDFARVVVFPRAVLVGLFCQILILPVVCYFIARGFALQPALAVGLMLLAASPGGATANLYSHLANGDVALNITLTAINSVLCIITLPIIVNLSLVQFMGEGQAIPLQFAKVVQVFVIVIGPVVAGMWVNHRFAPTAAKLRQPVKKLSVLFLVVAIALAAFNDRGNIVDNIEAVGAACLLFNLSSLAVGYWVPRLLRLDRRQAIAIGMEIGIHNGTLAIAIALSPIMLNNPTMAVPAAIYSGIMFGTAALFAWWANRRREQLPVAESVPVTRS